MYICNVAWNHIMRIVVYSKLNVASWPLSCMCTHQHLEFEVNSFDPYCTYQMWCVKCVAWWYWPCYHWQIGGMKLKSAQCTISSNVVYVHALTNTWNFKVRYFGFYYTHQVWFVQCIAWCYWSWCSPKMGDIWSKSAYVTSGFLSKAIPWSLM